MKKTLKHAPDPEIVATMFAGILRGWLNNAEWKEMRRQNAKWRARGERNVCASHDFCDANEAMLLALKTLIPDCDKYTGDALTPLWNEAWSIADKLYLTEK